MIQEKARKLIEKAVADRVSDIYLVPRGKAIKFIIASWMNGSLCKTWLRRK